MIALLERRWVRYPLFLLIAIITFFIALVFAFPDTEIKDIIEVQAEKALKHKYTVHIDDVDLYWLTGLELHGVEIQKVTENDALDKNLPDVIPLKFKIPLVAARLSLFSSLFNLAPAIQFKVDLGGGTISGKSVLKTSEVDLNANIGPIDLRKTPAITGLLGVPFFGEIEGNIDMTLSKKLRIPVSGSANLIGEKITFGPAVVKTDKLPAMAFIEVPQTNLGNLDIKLGVEKKGDLPETVVQKFNFGGRDLRGDIWGEVLPVADGRKVQLDLKLRLQFDTQYITKNNLKILLDIAKIRSGKNNDWYGFAINGTLPKVRFTGAPKLALGPQAKENQPQEGENPTPGDATADNTQAAAPEGGE